MKNFLLLIAIFLFALPHLFGQRAVIEGLVTDAETGEPLINANISILDGGTTSDLSGRYRIEADAGSYELIISYVGYQNQNIQVDLLAGQNLTLDLVLNLSETLLETAVVSGSRYETRLAESTVSVDIIRPDLLESTNAVTLDAVLDKIPGVQILQDQPNIRGGSGWSFGAGSRVMLLIDDMPALQGDAGLVQWDDIPVENVSQVEVLKGASSTLYGSAALNGIIHFRTAYATSDPVTQVSLFHTRYGRPKDPSKKWWTGIPHNSGMSMLHKQKVGKLDVVAGFYHFKQDSASTFRQEAFRSKTRANLKLRYRITDKANVELNTIVNDGSSSSFFLWSNGADGAYRPFPGTITKSENLRFIIDPSITIYDRKNNKHKLQHRYYYIRNDNNLDQSNKSFLNYLEYQHERDVLGSKLTFGAVGTWLLSDSELFSDINISSRNYAAYAQWNKKYFEKLNVSLGSRYEYNKHNTPEEFNGAIIPDGKIKEGKIISRAGANFEVGEASFLRASWGQGYRFPTITERFIRTAFSGFTIFSNPFLESETGWSSEIGIKQGFNLFNFKGFLDIAFFKSEYENMMEFTFHEEDGLTGFQSQNIGNTAIDGFEISVAGQLNLWSIPFKLMGGYTYLDPKYKNFNSTIEEASSVDYNVLKYRTKHSLTFDIEGQWKDLNVGFSLIGASHMEAIDRTLEDFATIRNYRNFNNMGYNRYDMRLGYRFKHYKLSTIINNIFNEEYTERPAFLEPPRNISMRLDFKI